ncbi:MAG: hypothetical protein AAGD34_12505 [Pseudomonadota bacterium]
MDHGTVFAGTVSVQTAAHADGLVLLELEAPPQFQTAKAGQFVMLASERADMPLLPRPFSILSVGTTLSLGFAVVGEGTRVLAKAQAGDDLYLMGPLGTVYAPDARPVLIVADASHFGTPLGLARALAGEATVVFVTRPSDQRPCPYDDAVTAAHQDAAALALFAETGASVETVALDGLKACLEGQAPGTVCAGASDPVMAVLQQVAEAKGWPGEVSLQAPMACAVGACEVCIRPTRDGRWLKVCEGPVVPLQTPRFQP